MRSISKITKELNGKSFSEVNCLQLVKLFMDEAGVDFPTDYSYIREGINLDNYLEYFDRDKKGAIEDMITLFKTLGKPVELNRLKKFDILVLSQEGAKYPAVYIGRNLAMASFIETGVAVFNLGLLCKPILARRLI